MTLIKPSEISVADTLANQSRREALKKFGRYAAAAPTAMILLQPRESHAGKARGGKSSRGGKWGRGGKGRKRGNSHY